MMKSEGKVTCKKSRQDTRRRSLELQWIRMYGGERGRTNCREGPRNHFTRSRTRLSRMKTRDPCHWRKVIFPCATESNRDSRVQGYIISCATPRLVFLGIELLFGFSCSSGWETIPSSSRASSTPVQGGNAQPLILLPHCFRVLLFCHISASHRVPVNPKSIILSCAPHSA